MRKRDHKRIEKEIEANHKLNMHESAQAELAEAQKLEDLREKKPKKKGSNLSDAECQVIAQELANKMAKAVEDDNANNVKKLPALKKYLLVEEVTRQLRRSAIS